MLKKESCSETDLVNFYYSCELFKKYCRYNLWLGYSEEYFNIKYCKKYICMYTYCWVYTFLLQCYSSSFVTILYRSPRFIKFIESGFLKYLDYPFLLSFHNNRFAFDSTARQKIKTFVKSYFQNSLKDSLKKDILVLVIEVMNEFVLNSLLKELTTDLKDIKTFAEESWSSDTTPIKENKVLFFFIGFLKFNFLIKKGYYRPCFIHFNNYPGIKSSYSFISSDTVHKSLRVIQNTKTNKSLKSVEVCKLTMEKIFVFTLVGREILYRSTEDIQYLIECSEPLDGFEDSRIGLYKNSNVIFGTDQNQKHLLFKKSFEGWKLLKKSFDNSFVKYKCVRKL